MKTIKVMNDEARKIAEENYNLGLAYMQSHNLPIWESDIFTGEDWYGVIMEALCKAAMNYNPEDESKATFATYAWTCMDFAVKHVKYMEKCKKRCSEKPLLSLDYEYDDGEGENESLLDKLTDGLSMENEVIARVVYEQVLSTMTDKTQMFIRLLDYGYSQVEIAEMYHISRAAISAHKVRFEEKLQDVLQKELR